MTHFLDQGDHEDFGAVIYNRVVHEMEDSLHPAEYAYRRGRGTDMH